MNGLETSAELEPLLSVRETCAYLRVSPTTLWRLNRSGELPGVRIGARKLLFQPETLRAFVGAREGVRDMRRPRNDDDPASTGSRVTTEPAVMGDGRDEL